MSLEQVVEMANRYGGDDNMVLTDVGNVSYKEGGVLYITGSGDPLAAVAAENLVRMDLAGMADILYSHGKGDEWREEISAEVLAARMPGQDQKIPSSESLFHVMFPYAFVLHTHPCMVNGLTCAANGEQECKVLFNGEAVWVPARYSGGASACRELCDEYAKETGAFPKLVFVQNHGVFVAGDSVEEIDIAMAEIMVNIAAHIPEQPDFSETEFDLELACRLAPALRMLYHSAGKATAIFCTNTQIRSLVENESTIAPLLSPLTHDQIRCSGLGLLFVEAKQELDEAMEAYHNRYGEMPRIVAVRQLGFFALGLGKVEAEAARKMFLDAVKVEFYTRFFGGAAPLPAEEARLVAQWQRKHCFPRRELEVRWSIAGKIALVTQGSVGYGAGMVEFLVRQGCHVVVADTNYDAARDLAEEVCQKYPQGAAIAVQGDAARPGMARAMVQAAVIAYGGLDLLVFHGNSPGSSAQSFAQTVSESYSGYYHCIHEAVSVMAVQHSFAEECLTDIVDINSYTGLAGSSDPALAGSYAGRLGLTRGFAAQLLESGVKINAICPSGELDIPARAPKVQQDYREHQAVGIPRAVVGEVYRPQEARAPMGRACKAEDVARALQYLVEQQYETGQALPVTGGRAVLG